MRPLPGIFSSSIYLRQCGNDVIVQEDENDFAADVLYNLLNRKTSADKPLATHVKDVYKKYRESEHPEDTRTYPPMNCLHPTPSTSPRAGPSKWTECIANAAQLVYECMDLTEQTRAWIDEYFAAMQLLSGEQHQYLYLQGAKDMVQMLRKFDVIK